MRNQEGKSMTYTQQCAAYKKIRSRRYVSPSSKRVRAQNIMGYIMITGSVMCIAIMTAASWGF